jgi:hypothetical protein
VNWRVSTAYARIKRRHQTPISVHFRHWSVRMDLRIVLPVAASAALTLGLVIVFVQPWNFGKWNLDDGAGAVVCSALTGCRPDERRRPTQLGRLRQQRAALFRGKLRRAWEPRATGTGAGAVRLSHHTGCVAVARVKSCLYRRAAGEQ